MCSLSCNPFDRLLSWYSHLTGERNAEDAGILYGGPGLPLPHSPSSPSVTSRSATGYATRCRRRPWGFAAFVRLPADGADGLFARFHANQIDYLTLDGRFGDGDGRYPAVRDSAR